MSINNKEAWNNYREFYNRHGHLPPVEEYDLNPWIDHRHHSALNIMRGMGGLAYTPDPPPPPPNSPPRFACCDDYEEEGDEVDKFLNKNRIECSICLTHEIKEFIKIDCNHSFHRSCLKKWLEINKNCPICRKDIKL